MRTKNTTRYSQTWIYIKSALRKLLWLAENNITMKSTGGKTARNKCGNNAMRCSGVTRIPDTACSSTRQSDYEKGPNWNIVQGRTITDKMTRRAINSERSVIAIQRRYGRIVTDQCQSVTGHPNTMPGIGERALATLIQRMPVTLKSRYCWNME